MYGYASAEYALLCRRSDISLPPGFPEQLLRPRPPQRVFGQRGALQHTLCYSPACLVTSKFPNDGCFSCPPGLPPQPRRLPRPEGTGFQRTGRGRTAAARLRGQGGAWVVGVPLAPCSQADWPSLMRSLHLVGDHKKRAPSRRTRKIPLSHYCHVS